MPREGTREGVGEATQGCSPQNRREEFVCCVGLQTRQTTVVFVEHSGTSTPAFPSRICALNSARLCEGSGRRALLHRRNTEGNTRAHKANDEGLRHRG